MKKQSFLKWNIYLFIQWENIESALEKKSNVDFIKTALGKICILSIIKAENIETKVQHQKNTFPTTVIVREFSHGNILI